MLNANYSEPRVSFKKDKKLPEVDRGSLKKMQRNIKKLRPIKERLEKKLNKIKGFSGIILSNGKISILSRDEESKDGLVKAIPTRYLKYIDVVNVMPHEPHNKKMIFGKGKVIRERSGVE